MKKVFILILMLLVVAAAIDSYSQAPQSFKYQSIARDGADVLLSNANIELEIYIRDLTPTGTLLYKEIHTITTNSLGLFTISIGQGTVVGGGTFSEINWSGGAKYIELAADLDGSGKIFFGSSQLLSVPYALWANGANPVGTLDDSPFLIKVNNEKAGYIGSGGEVFYGYQAGKNNGQFRNMGMGYKALFTNINGVNNTALGWEALFLNVAGENTAVGYSTLRQNTTGSKNTAIGAMSLYHNTLGSENTANGFNALTENTEGSGNTALGSSALERNVTGIENTAVGNNALKNNEGSENTGIGQYSLYSNTTGQRNTSVGTQTLFTNVTGNYNVAIGFLADVGSGSLTNATAIGSNAIVQLSNSMVFGSSEVTKWGFGVAAINPNNTFQVANGASLSIGGSWINTSDRNKKENFSTVDGIELLLKIEQLPITRWNYIGEDQSVTHIGPMAQDFYKLFAVGNDDKSISTIDPAGVSLAAIQELIKQLDELKVTIQLQQESIGSLKAENSKLKSSMEARIEKLEAMLGMNAKK